MANLLLGIDETGNFQDNYKGKSKRIVGAVVFLRKGKEDYKKLIEFYKDFENFIKETVSNYGNKYNINDKKIHFMPVLKIYGSLDENHKKVILEKFDSILKKHKDFILKRSVFLYLSEVNYKTVDKVREYMHSIHLYLYILKHIIKSTFPIISFFKSEGKLEGVNISLEELQFLRVYNKAREIVKDKSSSEDKLTKYCKIILENAPVEYDIEIKRQLEKSLDLKKITISKKKEIEFLADFYLSFINANIFKDSYFKDEFKKNMFMLSGERKILNDTKANSFNIKVYLNEDIAFLFKKEIKLKIGTYEFNEKKQVNVKINKELANTKIESILKETFEDINMPVGVDIRLNIYYDTDLSLLKSFTDKRLEHSSADNQKLKELKQVIPYLFDISILSKLDIINIKELNRYMENLPQLDIYKKYVNDLTPKYILKLIFDIINFDLSQQKNPKEAINTQIKKLEQIDNFPLIKYYLLSMLSYEAGKEKLDFMLEEIQEKIEYLENQIPNNILELLNYDFTHQYLNNLYYRGDFNTIKKYLSSLSNRYNLIAKIKASPSFYKRRYLNLLAKILIEMYEGKYAYGILTFIIDDLAKKSDISEELYRTKGTLAELLARFGKYEEAIKIYEENEKLTKEYEEFRTISQKLYPLAFVGLINEDTSIQKEVIDWAEYLIENYKIEEKYKDILYPLSILSVLMEKNEFLNKYNNLFEDITSNLSQYSAEQLPVAIIQGRLGKHKEAIERLINANYIIEALDYLNSKFGKNYKSEYENIIQEKLSPFKLAKVYQNFLNGLLNELNIDSYVENSKLESQEKFFEKLNDDKKEQLITYRLSLLNYVEG